MFNSQNQEESERNLSSLKRHRQFPFPNYRADDEQYMLLEMYWTYLFKATVHGNINREWRAWRPPDQTHEGNPIFSAKNDVIGRAVRVIQNPDWPGPNAPVPEDYFSFEPFLSHAPTDLRESTTQILEMCFVADLSAESEKRCREFLQYFCVDRLSEMELEQKIKQYELAVGMPELPKGFES